MTIDPKGTSPGLPPKEDIQPKTFMKCRNLDCPSNEVVEMKIPGEGQRLYRCTKCYRTMSVPVGGNFNY